MATNWGALISLDDISLITIRNTHILSGDDDNLATHVLMMFKSNMMATKMLLSLSLMMIMVLMLVLILMLMLLLMMAMVVIGHFVTFLDLLVDDIAAL